MRFAVLDFGFDDGALVEILVGAGVEDVEEALSSSGLKYETEVVAEDLTIIRSDGCSDVLRVVCPGRLTMDVSRWY